MKNTISKKSDNLSQDVFENSLNKTVTLVSHSMPLKDSKEGNLCDFKNVDDVNLFTPRKDHNENNALILHPWYFHSSFVFGKVSVASENDGIAITINTFKQNEVFFKSEVIFSENTKITPIKDSIVLLYIPYVESEDSVCVATLVYPLNPEETVLFKENITIENFVMNNFSPIVQKRLGAIYSCFCGFTHTLMQKLLISQKFEIKRKKIAKTFDFVKSLREAFCFSEKTLTLFYMLINELFTLNLGFSYTKICSGLAFIFVQAFSFTVCSKKLTILSKGKKTFNYHNHRRNHSSSHFLSHIKATCSEISEAAVVSLKEKMNLFSHEKFDIKEEILVERNDSCLLEKESDIKLDTALLLAKPFVKEGNESSISINSYKSCNSKSSEEVYYSCESLPDKFDAYSEKSLLIHSNSTHLFKDDDCNNTIICNEINSPSLAGKNSDPLNEEKDIDGMTVSNLSKKYTEKFELADKSDFKVRHSSIFKAKNKRINHRIILSSSSHHCQECWKPKTETTAHISTITKSYLYFCVNLNQQVATLGFPKHLVSEKILNKLSSSSAIKIGIIPNILIHFSDVLYINLC
ncbi:hypothetical protein HNY73_008465 [Argiope bruennichi]|uniref:Uncharacterized protein n=1 Tax=Argiope bruennichi TaxID=94029 RepID=A0A8T0FCY4_ARGBR|nr:hypothetical protein HNY73_008465 [Argiope bruennichi]